MNARGTGSRYLLVAVICALAVVGAVGCSSSKSSKDTQTSSTASSSSTARRTDVGTSEADLKTAAHNYTAAVLSSHPIDSYPYLSKDCQAKWTADAWAANESRLIDLTAKANPSLQGAKAGDAETRNMTPTSGEATTKLLSASGDPLSDTTGWYPWAVQDSMWVLTTCDDANKVFATGS